MPPACSVSVISTFVDPGGTSRAAFPAPAQRDAMGRIDDLITAARDVLAADVEAELASSSWVDVRLDAHPQHEKFCSRRFPPSRARPRPAAVWFGLTFRPLG